MQMHHDTCIVQTMGDAFRIHFTPKYSQITNGTQKGKDYKFFNKPMGVLHWLNSMTDNAPNASHLPKDDIVVLLDPDQILTQPITGDFSSFSSVHNNKHHSKKVQHGMPFGQLYALGDKWTNFHLANITKDEQSPAIHVSSKDAIRYYRVGPPYLATVQDMHRIAIKWAEFAPLVHEEYPHLLAEMYAYCIAAAHLNLKHQVMNTLMVSNTGMGREEGWDLIDGLQSDHTCWNASFQTENLNHMQDLLPTVIHYCQRYMIGKWFFGKRKMPKDIFSCTSPLLQMPSIEESKTLSTIYNYAIPPPPHKPPGEHKHIRHPKREAFMFCYLTNAVNEAAMFYQERHCHGTQKPPEPLHLWAIR